MYQFILILFFPCLFSAPIINLKKLFAFYFCSPFHLYYALLKHKHFRLQYKTEPLWITVAWLPEEYDLVLQEYVQFANSNPNWQCYIRKEEHWRQNLAFQIPQQLGRPFHSPVQFWPLLPVQHQRSFKQKADYSWVANKASNIVKRFTRSLKTFIHAPKIYWTRWELLFPSFSTWLHKLEGLWALQVAC